MKRYLVGGAVRDALIGLGLGFGLMVSGTWIFRKWHPYRLDHLFRRLQLVSERTPLSHQAEQTLHRLQRRQRRRHDG